MKIETSYIPMAEEYVYPSEYIESGMLPDCIVDSKRMLGDQKAQDVANFQAATGFLLQLYQLGYTKLDFDKLASETLDFGGIDPKRILSTDDEGSEMLNKVKEVLSKMESAQSNQSNAPIPQPPPAQANTGTALPRQGGSGSSQNALEATAGSTI